MREVPGARIPVLVLGVAWVALPFVFPVLSLFVIPWAFGVLMSILLTVVVWHRPRNRDTTEARN